MHAQKAVESSDNPLHEDKQQSISLSAWQEIKFAR
jgi:hypothetical protein